MELDDILWTLLPLIMLIVVSWVLSFLGSRVTKKRQEEEMLAGETEQGGSGELFMNLGDEELFEPSPTEQPSGPARTRRVRSEEWDPLQGTEPPPITPEPIKPKWWGA